MIVAPKKSNAATGGPREFPVLPGVVSPAGCFANGFRFWRWELATATAGCTTLAIRFEGMVRDGVVWDQSESAGVGPGWNWRGEREDLAFRLIRRDSFPYERSYASLVTD
jgi:hypothetical protein